MRYRNRIPVVWVLVGASILFSLLLATFIYYQFFKLNQVAAASRQMVLERLDSERKRYSEHIRVIIADDTLKQGETIDATKVKEIEAPIGFAPEDAVRQKDALKQKAPRFEIRKGTILASNMLADYNHVVSDDLRKQDYFNIKKFYSLKKGDMVDVRIKRADGSDDVVISKKEVADIVEGMVCFNVNGQERSNLNYATVECYASKAELYTTLYVDPVNQPAAVVTFKPNDVILGMVRNNPAVVDEARNEMARKEREVTQRIHQTNSTGSSINNPGNEATTKP